VLFLHAMQGRFQHLRYMQCICLIAVNLSYFVHYVHNAHAFILWHECTEMCATVCECADR
jgi:hypothetical protein